MAATLTELHQHIEEKVTGEEASFIRGFSEVLFDKAYPEFLKSFEPESLLAMTMGALQLFSQGAPDEVKIRAYNPIQGEHGWAWSGSVLEILLKDRPFLVDSVRAELRRRGVEVAFYLHPIVKVHRDSEGRLVKTAVAQSPASQESYQLYVLEEKLQEDRLRTLEEAVRHVLDDVVLATDDYPALRARSEEIAAYLLALSKEPGTSAARAAELRENAEFIHWLGQHNFVFLGFREYNIFPRDGEDHLQLEPSSGLGILRGRSKTSSYRDPVPLSRLPENLRTRVLHGPLLLVTKANSEATVHRPVRMDYVGVKKQEGGIARGELRLLGLFTSQALSTPCKDIPILRHKLRRVLEMDGSPEGSHDYKQIVSIFNSMPREELFWAEPEALLQDLRTIMRMESEHQVRLTVRRDPLARGVLVMVIMPRERFNAGVRYQIQELLSERFRAHHVDYQLSIGEEEHQVRFHFFLSTDAGVDGLDLKGLEAEVALLTRTWDDRLAGRLEADLGEEGRRLASAYAGAFNDAYKACNPPERAAGDVAMMERFGARMYLVDLHSDPAVSWLKIYHRRNDLTLSDTMPLLENLGLIVLEQLSFTVRRQDGQSCGIDVYRVLDRNRKPLRDEVRPLLAEAMSALLEGRAQDDRLNGLVLGAGLSWRQVSLLRVYQIYLSQIESTSRRFINETLLNHPTCARGIHDFFDARFNPATSGREQGMKALREGFFESLNQVSSLAEDRTLRSLFNLVEATIRSNFFKEKDWISLKISSQAVDTMPDPRPLFEIVVVAAGVEGIHLRGGKVARGGLRWSDRPDFRTEVLGLMKTQMTKNAVIVPVGSKGGFLLKKAPTDRDELRRYVTDQYKVFIRGLLDLTDNVVESRVVHPEGLVLYDEADPYLVVAADKGTATFSDTANSVAAEYDFWLGDAFASGGSYGYDHKKEGITARGAWECVKRHFREAGIDIAKPFTVAGIGDLSGDVFGNGLIYSDQIRLQAAFNHLHIFLDPDPDPAVSFRERVRMFGLARSTWDDYDKALISQGGGVFPRHAKSIQLSPRVREMLGIEAERLSGDDLVKAILRMPVDLLWNGGIGTYVKATSERNVDVGDSNNDAVRVNATELRCRVIGEGGNNGCTQLARVEYARLGGRINTDAIDNSAGVDMSDHEVNIKILLQPMVAGGKLSLEDRNALLGEMTREVNQLVLTDNYRQSLALSLAESRCKKDLGLFTSLIDYLEERGGLRRDVEFLPEARQLAERQRSGEGLTRPELAIVLAYTKMGLYRRLLETDFPEEPHFQHYLYGYFPTALAERYPREIAAHQLRREIIATQFTNKVVDVLGVTFVHRTIRNTGATPVGVVRAALMALEILNLDPLLEQVFALDNRVPAQVQYDALMAMVETVESVVNQMLLIHGVPASVSDFVKAYREPLLEIRDRFPDLLPASEQELFLARQREFHSQGLPAELAASVATLAYLPSG
ncbi:MAG: NAD-glutamate dehydrogenase, partial [Candidatus Eremiobacterota bacterium]